jgi:hypothetical protein
LTNTPPCPYCGASSFQLRDERWLLCAACGHEFDLHRDLCRRCGWVNRAQDSTCAHCAASLPRDPVERLIDVRTKDRRAWFKLYKELGLVGKEGDQHASEARMQSFLAEDRARREALAQARTAQRIRERRMLIVIGVIAAVIVGLILALALLGPLSELAGPALLPGAAPSGGWGAVVGIGGSGQTVLG